jgi:hypothetical protein
VSSTVIVVAGGRVPKRLAPSLQSLIGDEPQPNRVHGLPVQPAHGGGLAAHVERNAGPVSLDGGDFHGTLLGWELNAYELARIQAYFPLTRFPAGTNFLKRGEPALFMENIF